MMKKCFTHDFYNSNITKMLYKTASRACKFVIAKATWHTAACTWILADAVSPNNSTGSVGVGGGFDALRPCSKQASKQPKPVRTCMIAQHIACQPGSPHIGQVIILMIKHFNTMRHRGTGFWGYQLQFHGFSSNNICITVIRTHTTYICTMR